MAIELTLFTKTDGPCTKHISLVGGRMVSDGSACGMSIGRAHRLRLAKLSAKTPLHGFAALLALMKSNQAVCLGCLAREVSDRPGVVTERRRKEDPKPNVISRTRQFLQFAKNEPRFLLVDFDRKGMPQDIAARIDRSGGAFNALAEAFPGLDSAGRVSRTSTSAGIYNTETGECFPGSGGEHHYVLVADSSDIPRALADMHDRAWLAGLGWYMPGAVGQILERSIIDRSVGSPEHLVFEGPAMIVAPLAQDQSTRRPRVKEGIAIDTRAVIPPLTDAERDIVRSLKDAARRQVKPDADRARRQSDRALAEKISAKTGVHLTTALRHVEKRHDGMLMPSVSLEFDDGEIGAVTVANILDNPDRFIDETLADPLEGADYGRCKAKVMRGDEGEILIHSFAHGGVNYRLVLDAAKLKQEIEKVPPQSAVDGFISKLCFAQLEDDERTQLRDYVAARAGVGKRDINLTAS